MKIQIENAKGVIGTVTHDGGDGPAVLDAGAQRVLDDFTAVLRGQDGQLEPVTPEDGSRYLDAVYNSWRATYSWVRYAAD